MYRVTCDSAAYAVDLDASITRTTGPSPATNHPANSEARFLSNGRFESFGATAGFASSFYVRIVPCGYAAPASTDYAATAPSPGDPTTSSTASDGDYVHITWTVSILGCNRNSTWHDDIYVQPQHLPSARVFADTYIDNYIRRHGSGSCTSHWNDEHLSATTIPSTHLPSTSSICQPPPRHLTCIPTSYTSTSHPSTTQHHTHNCHHF